MSLICWLPNDYQKRALLLNYCWSCPETSALNMKEILSLHSLMSGITRVTQAGALLHVNKTFERYIFV